MRVRVGARIAGSNKTVEVELEDSDMPVDGWFNLPLAARFQKMSNQADLMVVEYMYRRGDISKEFAAQRIREIQSGS